MGVEDDEGSADDTDSVQKSFLKIIRLITTSDLPTTQLASFRTTITAMSNFSLDLIEKIWSEAANKLELRKAIEFFDHALDVAIQGAGVTMEKDGVWISRMLLAIFALPEKKDLAPRALKAWNVWVCGENIGPAAGDRPVLPVAAEGIDLAD